MVSKFFVSMICLLFAAATTSHTITENNSTAFYDAVSLADVWQPPPTSPENDKAHLPPCHLRKQQ